jgi:hypothetical protein
LGVSGESFGAPDLLRRPLLCRNGSQSIPRGVGFAEKYGLSATVF